MPHHHEADIDPLAMNRTRGLCSLSDSLFRFRSTGRCRWFMNWCVPVGCAVRDLPDCSRIDYDAVDAWHHVINHHATDVILPDLQSASL